MVLLRGSTAVRAFALGFFLIWWALLVANAAEDPQTLDTAERVAFLRAEIARHDELYFREARPEISDFEYDQLKRELIELQRKHPEIVGTKEKSRGMIGDDRTAGFAKQRHLVRMLSLEKAYSREDLERFTKRIARALPNEAVNFVIEPKFDGVAVSATYVDGKLERVVTRGDGEEGDNVTANARRFCELPDTLRTDGGPVPALVEVRGEVFITRAEFARINEEQSAMDERPYANPRNLAAGTLKSLDEEAAGARKLSVVFFGIGELQMAADEAPASQTEALSQIKSWGLKTPEVVQRVATVAELWAAIRRLERDRAEWAFPTDGVVVKLNAFPAQRALGESAEAPRWAIAFKFAPERVRTRVEGITLQVGRTGLITPVAELTPVTLGGATVTRATLHNAEEIRRLDLRVGDEVWVERAGEIVPAIVDVEKTGRTADSAAFSFPSECPSCDAKLEREEGKAAWRCLNAACPAQLKRRLLHFAAADAAAIQGLGPATIERLVDAGKVTNLADLYRLTSDDLARIEGVGASEAARLSASIEASKRRELWRIVSGLGIPGLGVSSAKKLAREIRDLGDLIALGELTREDVRIEPRIHAALAAHVSRTGSRTELKQLDEIGVGVASLETKAGPLRGMTFVLTGTLPNLSRREAIARIEAAGGNVASSVSAETTFVVAGSLDGGTSETLRRAERRGIRVIDEAALLALIAGHRS